MFYEQIRKQVQSAMLEAMDAWGAGRRTFALWNHETGDRLHFD